MHHFTELDIMISNAWIGGCLGHAIGERHHNDHMHVQQGIAWLAWQQWCLTIVLLQHFH